MLAFSPTKQSIDQMNSLPFKDRAVVALIPGPSSSERANSLIHRLTDRLRDQLENDSEISLVSEDVVRAAESKTEFPDTSQRAELEELGITPFGAHLSLACNVAIFIRTAWGQADTIEIASGRPPSCVGHRTLIRAANESDIDAFSYRDSVRDDIALCLDGDLFAAHMRGFFEGLESGKSANDRNG